MSASMLRQMLVEAAAFLKDGKYQEALDSSRRVMQLDAGNFQALICVGLASFHLEQWSDSETAFERAAELKPGMPAPWKGLADLFEASGQPEKKLDALDKLVAVLRRMDKIKPCQNRIAEIASTATGLKQLPRAFNAWYSLVGRSGDSEDVSLLHAPNPDLPSPFDIWLDVVELLQRPGFELADCGGDHSLSSLSNEYFEVVSSSPAWREPGCAAHERVETTIAFFMRHHIDALQNAKDKKPLLHRADELAQSIIEWNRTAKLPAEYLLLRSEDESSPISVEAAHQIAGDLASVHARSPMVLIFQGVKYLEEQSFDQAHDSFVDGISAMATSSFQEAALCIRGQVELASLALRQHDVEGCLSRLSLAKASIAEKEAKLGCGPPSSSVYSEARSQFMSATAQAHAGAIDKALELYRSVVASGDDSLSVEAALAAAELLLDQGKADEALTLVDELPSSVDDAATALISCTRGWILFVQGDATNAHKSLEASVSGVPASGAVTKGKVLKRLAIVYWHLGGSFRADKPYCFSHLLQAAKLVPSDGETFAWLGKWYLDVAADIVRAEKCFLKALSLSPTNELAGKQLSDLYATQGKHELNVKLWEDVTRDPQHAPTWALIRLAQHLVDQDDELAVGKLHLVLRNEPLNATYWVALAHVYSHFGKHVSAHKSYLKAIELGEDSWCVRCELARIEGGLHLYDEALERVEPVIAGFGNGGESDADQSTVSMIYSDLLFQQAKSLCADGLYGRAAANLLKASKVMKSLPSSSPIATSPEALNLIGDLHSFAFYLSPNDFNTENEEGWVRFVGEGRRAYEAAVGMLKRQPNVESQLEELAELYYNIGLSYWYEALAILSTCGAHLGATLGQAPFTAEINSSANELVARAMDLKLGAITHFKLSLRLDSGLALGWNGLGAVHDSLLVKQFAWTRAIQSSNLDAAWANMGMFYLSQSDALSSAASLAQRAFLQLQSVNADNPAMWNGYAMLARRQTHSPKQQDKSIEAFSCALQNGMDLDALLGLALQVQSKRNGAGAGYSDEDPSDEEILFYLRKYIERDPFSPAAWNALGVAQQRVGLYAEASTSYARSLALCKSEGNTDTAIIRQLEWNKLVAEIGAATARGDSIADKINELISMMQAVSPDKTSALILTAVLQAHTHREAKNWEKCIDSLRQLLDLDDHPTSSAASAAGTVALSMACLAQEESIDPDSPASLAAAAFARIVVDLGSGSDQRVVDLYNRLRGSYGAYLLQHMGGTTPTNRGSPAWTRLGLAMVDLHLLKAKSSVAEHHLAKFVSTATAVAVEDTEDAAILEALVSLLTSDWEHNLASPMKLVRMKPWDPSAYIIAGLGVLKRVNYEPSTTKQQTLLEQLVQLLDTGRQCATQHRSESLLAQLELLSGYCYRALDDPARAKQFAEQGLQRLASTGCVGAGDPALQAQLQLLSARLQSITKPDEAVSEYHQALHQLGELAKSTGAIGAALFTSVLCELAELYEEMGVLDGAIQVWRLLTNQASEFGAVAESGVEVAGVNASFLANLRLALVHGAKNQAKIAKKHAKSAVTLAGDDAVVASRASVVAAFVEKVVGQTA